MLSDEIYFISDPKQIEHEKQRTNEQPCTQLHLSITLDPQIQLPEDNDLDHVSGAENPEVLLHATEWQNNLIRKLKHKRAIKVFGENIDGKSVLLCKYLKPLKPPSDVCNLEGGDIDNYAHEKVARFVSMIPFTFDLQLSHNAADMYLDSQDFLDLGSGDYEEHAILLANYFMYIDEKQKQQGSPCMFETFLVYGYAVPENSSVYVLRKFKDPN